MPPPPASSSATFWFTSSYSGGNTTECVECAWDASNALVRDSKRPTRAVLAVRAHAWRAFISAVSADEIPAPNGAL
ncbi:hypothetical protein SLA_2611 [Streptomyces laurentii]|uniref:DUF397 domain-containing protein n=1 Tax=Streptomyces laurentii TaxID=39478 RepID=A0A160NYY3_STRLU|nr:hypothetical protein SLA_2611 [Streptomyces laurentii]